jgi:hypothetical protein
MRTNALKTIALSAGLFFAGAAFSAYALDVHVGGISISALGGGGAPAATGNTGNALGGATASASALGRDGTVADVNLGVPSSNKAHVRIGLGAGPLASLDSNGNPVNGGSATNGTINLGGLLGLGGLGGIDDGPGAAGPGTPGAIVAGLSSGQQAKLRANCKMVLRSPASYQQNLVSICRLLRM